MSEHDPLCPRIDELTLTPYCLCPLLSRVRDDERERIAAAMSDAIADRVTWDDGSEFIAVVDAARIARSGGDR